MLQKIKAILTVVLEGNDWRYRYVAVKGSFRVFCEKNRRQISSVAPTVSAYFRRINNFEIVS